MSGDIFLVGRHALLRAPDLEKDVAQGDWHGWFNDQNTTRYLAMGAFPNTRERQLAYVARQMEDAGQLFLCIVDKESERFVGVIRLYGIDFIERTATVSLVIGEKEYHPAVPLEALALVTGHAFDRMNLVRINSGQSENLWPWINAMELIGYRIDGYFEGAMTRNGEAHGVVHTSITARDYRKLKAERGGRIMTTDAMALLATRKFSQERIKRLKRYLEQLYR